MKKILLLSMLILGFLEKNLFDSFITINRDLLVNSAYMSEMLQNDKFCTMKLVNGICITVSRRRVDALKERIILCQQKSVNA